MPLGCPYDGYPQRPRQNLLIRDLIPDHAGTGQAFTYYRE